MALCDYMVILGGDLTTPEQIQGIAGLSALLECVDVSRVDADEEDEEEQEQEQEDEEAEDEDEEAEKEEIQWGCWVDVGTHATLLEWAEREHRIIRRTFYLERPASTVNASRIYPVPYFFYGTLADPRIWSQKLGVDEVPVLKKGLIRGWKVQRWEKYQALVKAGGDEEVEGWVHMVNSEDEVGKLAGWEGNNYKVERCEIVYESGERTEGNVFVFCGDSQQLRDTPSEEERQTALTAGMSGLHV